MSISVVMISLTPSCALSTPGMNPHSAPAAAPASIITGITTIAGVPGGRIGASTTAPAPHAPSRNWPSAPMFQRRIRKASGAGEAGEDQRRRLDQGVRQDADVAERRLDDVERRP